MANQTSRLAKHWGETSIVDFTRRSMVGFLEPEDMQILLKARTPHNFTDARRLKGEIMLSNLKLLSTDMHPMDSYRLWAKQLAKCFFARYSRYDWRIKRESSLECEELLLQVVQYYETDLEFGDNCGDHEGAHCDVGWWCGFKMLRDFPQYITQKYAYIQHFRLAMLRGALGVCYPLS